MTLIASIVGWIGRHILLFILIIIAMIAYAQYQKSSRGADQLEASVGRMESAEAKLDAMIMARRHEAVTGLKAAERRSLDAIEARLGEARAELAALPKAGLDPLATARDTWAFTSGVLHLLLSCQKGSNLNELVPTMIKTHMAMRRLG